MSTYDRLLQALLESIAAEVGDRDFERLHYRLRLDSPSMTDFSLVYWQSGREVRDDALGDGLWRLGQHRALRALQAASVAEGRGDFDALSLTLFPDGRFDLDFSYPEPVAPIH